MTTTFRSNGYTNYKRNPMLYGSGKELVNVDFNKTILAAGGSNGDMFVLSGPHTLDDRIAHIVGKTPAMTSASDNDLGFFRKNDDGTFTALKDSAGVSAKDILWNGADLSSALTYDDQLQALNTSLDTTKPIGDLLGLGSDSEPVGGVFLVLTTNTASSATTVNLNLQILIDEANTK